MVVEVDMRRSAALVSSYRDWGVVVFVNADSHAGGNASLRLVVDVGTNSGDGARGGEHSTVDYRSNGANVIVSRCGFAFILFSPFFTAKTKINRFSHPGECRIFLV